MKEPQEYIEEKRLAVISKNKIGELMKEYANDVLDNLITDLKNTGYMTKGVQNWIDINKNTYCKSE